MDQISIGDLKKTLQRIEDRLQVIFKTEAELAKESKDLKEKRDKLNKVLEVFSEVEVLVAPLNGERKKSSGNTTTKGMTKENINRKEWIPPHMYVPRSVLREWLLDKVISAEVYTSLDDALENCRLIAQDMEGYRNKLVGESQIVEVIRGLTRENLVEFLKGSGWRLI